MSLVALETVDFRLVDAPENSTLATDLRAASALVTTDATDPRDVLTEALGDYAKLTEALYANGYYSGKVSIRLNGREAARVDPFAEPAPISSAQIEVDPGPRFTFGRAEVTPLAPDAPATPGFQGGDPAQATVVREAAQGAVANWRQAGHAKARIVGQSIVARHDQAKLDVGVTIDPGPRATFGDTEILGDSGVRAARIRQIAGLPKGQVFDPDDVDKAASRLRRTGTFKSVTLSEADDISADGQLDMEIAVVDQKIRRIGAGAEFSSVDGLTLSANWLHRNLLGGAERFRVDSEISQITDTGEGIDYVLSFGLEKPAVYGPDTHFTSGLSFSYDDEPDFIERKAALNFGVSREFSEHLTGTLGIGVSYAEITDRFATGGDDFREMLIYSLPASLTYDRRDNALDTTNGYYLSGSIEPFYETVDAQAGAKFTFDARAFRSLGKEENVVLAGRLQLGSLVGPEAENAPPGHLFYSGGGGTVRGQPYNSLDADYGTNSLGGRSFAGLSTELRLSVTDTIGVVGFADAGFVSTDSFGGGSGDWHAGAGLGLRYQTPIGPIRFDVAAPVTDNTADGIQIYIGIGQAF